MHKYTYLYIANGFHGELIAITWKVNESAEEMSQSVCHTQHESCNMHTALIVLISCLMITSGQTAVGLTKPFCTCTYVYTLQQECPTEALCKSVKCSCYSPSPSPPLSACHPVMYSNEHSSACNGRSNSSN